MDSVVNDGGSMHGVGHRVDSMVKNGGVDGVVGNRVGNNTVVNSVVRQRVSHQAVVSHGVSDGMAEVGSMAGVGHDSAVAVGDDMAGDGGAGGGRGQGGQGGDDESLRERVVRGVTGDGSLWQEQHGWWWW